VHRCDMLERASSRTDLAMAGLVECGFNEKYDVERHGFVKKGRIQQTILYLDIFEDPRNYLEYIPWDELSLCSPFDNAPNDAQEILYAHWKPRKATKYAHHLHPNDAILQYCVELEIFLPGHIDSDCVAFILSPLDSSGIMDDFSNWWERWVSPLPLLSHLIRHFY